MEDDQDRKANYRSTKRNQGRRRIIKTEESNGCCGGDGGGNSGGRRMSCWSSLSDDILRTIMHKLCFSDQIRAAATCKGWRIRIPRRTTDLDHHLPWLIHQICYDQAAWTMDRRLVLKTTLYEPGNSNPQGPIKTAIDDFPTDRLMNIEPWYRPRILESKLGWLLVEIMDLENRGRRSCLVLYTPFGNTSAKPHVLPSSSSGGWGKFERVCVATFSSPPTSPDCVVFVYVKRSEIQQVVNYEIRMWRVGQVRWSRHPITIIVNVPELTRTITSTAHVNGILYCCFDSGLLLTFNSVNGCYKLVWSELVNTASTLYKVLVESNTELLLLVFKLKRVRPALVYNREGCSVIYRYDLSAKTWVRKPKLCDRVVFVSSCWHAMLVPVPARQMLVSCGKMYGLVKDGMIQDFRSSYDDSLLDDADSGLCCVFATYQHNTGGKDYVWLSYPFFD